MFIGKQFSFYAYLQWTKREILGLFLLAFIPTYLLAVYNIKIISLPLFVSTILGTTVAFVISFKNNAAYARLYEAQKLYADIRSASTYFGIHILDLLNSEAGVRLKHYIPQLINQHVAWLTTLRYQLRKEKVWENLSEAGNRDFSKFFRVFEHEITLDKALQPYLSQKKINMLLSKKNPTSYCLQLQTALIMTLTNEGVIDKKDRQYLLYIINSLIVAQSNCMRIKESPYPRNFYSITNYFLIGFLFILPYSLLGELDKIGRVWFTIPVSVLISWVFVTLEKVGQNTTNPFEGGINDVPITSLSRDIEIELKQMLNQDGVPDEIKPMNDILL